MNRPFFTWIVFGLHFQYEPGGPITSPQVPTGNQRDLAESGYITHEKIKNAGRKLSRLKGLPS
jgi:hypothetical protein